MALTDSIEKLKEIISLKEGNRQSCELEREVLNIFEGLAQEEHGIKSRIEQAETRAHEIRQKVKEIITEWQDAVLDLFRKEREAETLFNLLDEFQREGASHPGKSVHIASQRARWISEDIDPLSEGFREKLILDNRDYYTTRHRPRKKTRKKKNQIPSFVMEYYETLKLHRIPIPSEWEEIYKEIHGGKK